jgi:hypothetical protein
MFSLDAYIIEFVSGNWITLSLALGMLKIIAKMTPWVYDDALHTLLAGTFGLIPKPPSPVGFPAKEDRGVRLEQ